MTQRRLGQLPAALANGPSEGGCLDFVNTRFWRGSEVATETLTKPADLLTWCESARLFDAATLHAQRVRWTENADEANAALAEAIDLREAIFSVFAAAVQGGPPAPRDLAALCSALQATPARSRLHRSADGYLWELDPPADVRSLLAPVLWSTGDLLTGGRLGRVRQCANPLCRWLFIDDSKAGTRRWCSMTSCGNRAKAHRHYAKLRQAT